MMIRKVLIVKLCLDLFYNRLFVEKHNLSESEDEEDDSLGEEEFSDDDLDEDLEDLEMNDDDKRKMNENIEI